MTLSDFRASTSALAPPPGLGAALAALWWDAKGDWSRAHEAAAADEDGREAAWAHAYLHRKEGDADNALYWYGRAGHPMPSGALDDEWASIAESLLTAGVPSTLRQR